MAALLFFDRAALSADSYDIVIYGGTSGGVIAAVEAARLGRHVALIEPSPHLGGIAANGLGFTDVGNPRTIGGLSREFYHRIWLAYRDPAEWKFQPREKFAIEKGQGVPAIDDTDQVQWTFEPRIAERVFDHWIRESKVTLIRGRIAEKNGVEKSAGHIRSIKLEDGSIVAGMVFIDTSYEGDLMAAAGVNYTVGREANGQYGDTLNGIESTRARKNQLPANVDAFIRAGDPTSGLLSGVNPTAGGEDGAADHHVQAYCFRLCLTNDPANRVAIKKPASYDESKYELLFRAIEAGQTDRFFTTDRRVPDRKIDANNGSGLSLDLIGGSDGYPDATYAARDRILADHRLWTQGLIWTLQNHPRVPVKIRDSMSIWGLPKDEFADNDHWPRQLYIREGRRMVGVFVETESTVRDDSMINDSIGMGSYGMDSHNVQRYVDSAGHVRNEGDVQVAVRGPYKISYRAIVPKSDQCRNLLVPWCLSASHIAYGSIRMEPVFMTLSQSAAVAATIAVTDHLAVQDVPYEKLAGQLREEEKQLLLKH